MEGELLILVDTLSYKQTNLYREVVPMEYSLLLAVNTDCYCNYLESCATTMTIRLGHVFIIQILDVIILNYIDQVYLNLQIL